MVVSACLCSACLWLSLPACALLILENDIAAIALVATTALFSFFSQGTSCHCFFYFIFFLVVVVVDVVVVCV